MPTPVSQETLRNLANGTPVSLICCTTGKDIYYYSGPDTERTRVTPNPAQLQEIRYSVEGVVEGIEEGDFTYLVLSAAEGEKAQFGGDSGHARLLRKPATRFKVRHVPLSAVVRVIEQ